MPIPTKPVDPKKKKRTPAAAAGDKSKSKSETKKPAAAGTKKSAAKEPARKTKRMGGGYYSGCDGAGVGSSTMLTNSQNAHYAPGLPMDAANPNITNQVLNSMTLSQQGWAWGEHQTQYNGNMLVQSTAYDPANAGSFITNGGGGGRMRRKGV